jgi:Phosphotyrosyl phosphate activator (PTPA) protein
LKYLILLWVIVIFAGVFLVLLSLSSTLLLDLYSPFGILISNNRDGAKWAARNVSPRLVELASWLKYQTGDLDTSNEPTHRGGSSTLNHIIKYSPSNNHRLFLPLPASQRSGKHREKMAGPTAPMLKPLDPSQNETFGALEKHIKDSDTLEFWLSSTAYSDIMTFLLQLNYAMFPKDTSSTPFDSKTVGDLSKPILGLQDLLRILEGIIDEAPPDTGPRRFGNMSFRKWFDIVRSRLPDLLSTHIPQVCLDFPFSGVGLPARAELEEYLLGSFGSAQRLDYGTGHELSFLAFLGGIWKLGGFHADGSGKEERGIVLGVIEP